MLPFSIQSLCLNVCLSVSVPRSCIVHKRQKMSNRHDFFRIRQPHGSPRLRYNLAYIGRPLPPQIFSQSDPPLLIWVSETFDGKLRPNSTMVTTESILANHHRSFQWYHLRPLVPTTSPSLKMGVTNASSTSTNIANHDACCHLANMIQDVDKGTGPC